MEKPKMVSDSLTKQGQTVKSLKSEHDVNSSLWFTVYRFSYLSGLSQSRALTLTGLGVQFPLSLETNSIPTMYGL